MTVVGKEEAAPSDSQNTPAQDQKSKDRMFDNVLVSTPTDPSEGLDAAAADDSRLPGAQPELEKRGDINGYSYTQEELKITPQEKMAFIDAMITGERYRQTYTLFGGKITMTIRSRLTDETKAFYQLIQHSLNTKNPEIEYSSGDMSLFPLVVQIEELNGVKFPELKTPYTYTMSNGETNPPGWLEDFRNWKKRPEGLLNALIERVQLFEYKYWVMVKEAGSKNFWNTDTSTEGSKTSSDNR